MGRSDGSIRSAFDCMIRLGLTTWDRLVSFRSLDVPDEHRRTVLAPYCSHSDEFMSALTHRAYNFQLVDDSLIQLADHGRTKRFAHLPVPAELQEKELEDLGQDARPEWHTPPRLRVDVDHRSYVEFWHPRVHLTFGGIGACRIPIAFELDAALFVAFVARHVYLNNIEIDGGYTRDQQFEYLESCIRDGKSRMLAREWTLESERDGEQPYIV